MSVTCVYTLHCDRCGKSADTDAESEQMALLEAWDAGWETGEHLGTDKIEDVCPECVAVAGGSGDPQ